ncbi:PLP-dependent aspartate aminotransferase family protein [Fructilactobacillus myrtifloralis]|uniref:PLP-dependent aspartate aminotransferase family protein n=1 Tax=Fructilactobacillus myrtifloralis TaxID=2940301 RepID=A0ABY5BRA9_9LACO|nr:PLP-dependent aspartate aminotransferase family protein [Fructilactobacillus myrtifloralis]USS85582.1 PLP-dependent aspartate aminotransferase family protein [Fructilactobacillus myrtifloralis]
MKFDTKLLHGGISEDPTTGAVSMPIYRASTFHQPELGHPQWEYSRTGNPTRQALEKLMADLEVGTAGFAFSSGSAAIHAVLSLFSAGDHIIVGNDIYGGTFRLINQVMQRFGIEFSTVDTTNLAEVEAAFQDNTKALYLETPTNPLLKVSDLAALSQIAKRHQATTIVDNTFATPYNQQPLTLGANIVVASGTKYLGGHSDLIAGIAVTNNDQLAERIGFLQNSIGSILAPEEAWLLQRGIKTLGARMRVHEENTQSIFQFLSQDPHVSKLYYPGDPQNPGYDIAKRQMRGFGAMLSFELKPEYSPKQLIDHLQLITLAESLGGVDSLIEVPAIMTHGAIPRAERIKDGIQDNLIRLSVGIEDQADLIEDLQTALNSLDH